jgi:hypothetical protein
MTARLSILVDVDLPTGTQDILDASFPEKKGIQYTKIISGHELCKLCPSTVPWMVRNGYRELSFLLSITGDKEKPVETEEEEKIRIGKRYDRDTEILNITRSSWDCLSDEMQKALVGRHRKETSLSREVPLEILVDKI